LPLFCFIVSMMRPTLFISDLHLSESRPAITGLFRKFLDTAAAEAETLYILGDLFDYWVGDDQLEHPGVGREVATALKELSARGTKIFLMHGNRDFMLAERFTLEAGVKLLRDIEPLALHGRRLLLLHGDTLCTDDIAYQKFRLQSRDPAWQRAMLAQPYAVRQALAKSIRLQSDSEKSGKTEEIMDVTPATVERVFAQYNYPTIIHGHTHRPATHRQVIDGQACERWVLADWHEHGEYLRAAEDTFARVAVT
jgi:UDP-2,3-diacylglucosamine hydrolase